MDARPALVVLAAGVGSRYGGLKQLDGVGPRGETLMDYAVFDAVRAGVERVVFVIRRAFERDFHEARGRLYARRLDVAYAFQESDDLPPGRVKPWGTGHAVLSAAEQVRGSFLVSNADDFYGAEGYRLLVEFLARGSATPVDEHALVAYELRRTLSPHGSVSRGVCDVGPDGRLRGVHEHTRIEAAGQGAVSRLPGGSTRTLRGDEPVSLNLWGFRPGLLAELGARFEAFRSARGSEPGAEFLLPAVVDELIREGRAGVSVLRSGARWFGLTHRDDRALAAERLSALHDGGEYPAGLWT
jgi:hypothetical protein